MSALRIHLDNVDPVTREIVHSLVALLTDPALDQHRQRFVDGELLMQIDGGEVTWTDAEQVARELESRLCLEGSR